MVAWQRQDDMAMRLQGAWRTRQSRVRQRTQLEAALKMQV